MRITFYSEGSKVCEHPAFPSLPHFIPQHTSGYISTTASSSANLIVLGDSGGSRLQYFVYQPLAFLTARSLLGMVSISLSIYT